MRGATLGEKVAAGLVAVGVVVSVVSNIAFGSKIGNTSCGYRLDFSPSKRAFSIWAPIYLLSFFAVVEQAATHFAASEPLPSVASNALFAVAWISAALWTPAFTRNTSRSLVVAAALLLTTAGCALSAALHASFWRSSSNEARRWVSGGAFGMLAGWTAVASALNVGIAVQANGGAAPVKQKCDDKDDDYTILDPTGFPSTPVPLLIGLSVSVISVAVPDPVLPIPVAWAVAFMRPSRSNYAAFVALVCASTAAFVRVYAL